MIWVVSVLRSVGKVTESLVRPDQDVPPLGGKGTPAAPTGVLGRCSSCETGLCFASSRREGTRGREVLVRRSLYAVLRAVEVVDMMCIHML